MSCHSEIDMSSPAKSKAGVATTFAELARRHRLRVEGPLAAIVRGADVAGERFEIAATLDTLSGWGFHGRLGRVVLAGSVVFMITPPAGIAPRAPRLAARGMVLRAEEQAGGQCAVVVEFTRRRFLYGVIG